MKEQQANDHPETIRELLNAIFGETYEMRREGNAHRNWQQLPDPKPTWEEVISTGFVRRLVDGFAMSYLRRPTLPSDVLDMDWKEYLKAASKEI